MTEQIYFYPLWTRIWHGFNAILCLLLIFTGFSLQYSNPQFAFINFGLAVSVHNFSGISLTVSYFLFFLGNILTPNGKYYILKFRGLGMRLWLQLRYYAYGYFMGEESPFPVSQTNKFNPLQQISYIVATYIALPFLFITGWALLFPEFILKQVFGISGIFLTAQFHVLMAFVVTLFLIIHLYVSTMGKSPLSNFKSIITGWQKVH
jgi:thiosulfate reductase cytochrome b subunit